MMQIARAVLPAALLVLSPAPAPAEEASRICVLNGTGAELLFAVDNTRGGRALRTLAPQQQLCLPDAGGGGFVSVFTDAQAFEGCSRLVGENGRETLLAYADFDRCGWASQVDAGR